MKPNAQPVDVEAVKRRAYDYMVLNWHALNQWMVRLGAEMAGGIIGGLIYAETARSPAHTLISGAAGLTTAFSPHILSTIIDNAKFRDWVASGPSPADLKVLARVPNHDLATIKGAIADQTVYEGRKYPGSIHLGLATAKFLGPTLTNKVILGLQAASIESQASPATHHFSINRWRRAHPDADPAAAINKANQAGYQVVQ